MNTSYFECDVLVLGSGPSGMRAALTAAQHHAQVVVVDENPLPGGQIWRGGQSRWKDKRSHQLWEALQKHSHIRMLWQARLVWINTNEALLETPTHSVKLHFKKLILCNGARELLLPFPGWTLPSVMGAGGLQALIKAGMPVKGKRIVIAGTGPLLLAAAATATEAGAHVVAIVEHQKLSRLAHFFGHLFFRFIDKFKQALALRWQLKQSAYLTNAHVIRAVQAQDAVGVGQVIIKQGRSQKEIACDILACGFGLVPNTEIARHLGCTTPLENGYLRVWHDEQQKTNLPHVWVAGEQTGIGGVEQALVQGEIAGLAASGATIPHSLIQKRAHTRAFAQLIAQTFSPDGLENLAQEDTIVCRCEDITFKELQSHKQWRSAKLQTRIGMGACQGRICGAACQFLLKWPAVDLRPPLFPTQVSTLCNLPPSPAQLTESPSSFITTQEEISP